MRLTQKEKIEFFIPKHGNPEGLPYFDGGISAGFPSPADDFLENRISLDNELVGDTEATFYARVNGNSMEGAGLYDGDLLVIDRSIEPYDGCIAVCFVEGEFTVKRIKKEKEKVTLLPENPNYKPIVIEGETILVIWGVVTYSIKNHQKK
ncbi:translesion error-prone DNA polymerase V autoproteolytic subunit [Croceitalea sp. MTPC9]|uniref:LexA family protein n=1 Tax=unclassified Croceitalea TaxID=2632280 RepID=UPI002B3E9ED7|nr:translesion error-prone DNA polymerase V autoproteolytic subunit [Croceitalea sp. MTPC6]GMN18493.1 translesion error-prone DNA polymerase V autoproteolytic subunit [Croceitalea sp. MTPC9]